MGFAPIWNPEGGGNLRGDEESKSEESEKAVCPLPITRRSEIIGHVINTADTIDAGALGVSGNMAKKRNTERERKKKLHQQ